MLFVWRAQHALFILPFVDESGHILGARVLHAGGVLYRDFVDSHGPLVYALAAASERLPGRIDQPGAGRIVVLLAMVAATASVAASPCLRGAWERLCAVALFIGFGASVWVVQALCMLNYQPIAGMLLAIGCAQLTFCACGGVPPRRAGLFAAGAAFMLVPFAAYSYAPAALLLVLGGAAPLRRRWRPFAAGAAVAFAAIGAWVFARADPVGYLVYHFILNQFYFAPYVGFDLAAIPASFLPNVAPDRIAQSVGVAAGLFGWLGFAAVGGAGLRRIGALACLLLGLALSNPRASAGFQNGAFVVLGFATAAVALPRLPRALGLAPTVRVCAAAVAVFALLIAGAEAAARAAVSSPDGLGRAELVAALPVRWEPADDDWARRLRHAVAPGEPILVLPIQSDIYLRAGRLPMPGFDHYFPWDADYARAPWFGRGRDLCAALAQAPPPVIFDDEAAVWGRYVPKDYIPCLAPLLASTYTRENPQSFFYIRNDRVAAWRASP